MSTGHLLLDDAEQSLRSLSTLLSCFHDAKQNFKQIISNKCTLKQTDHFFEKYSYMQCMSTSVGLQASNRHIDQSCVDIRTESYIVLPSHKVCTVLVV